MLSIEVHNAIFGMVKGFSEYTELNALIYGRCMKAVVTRSIDDLVKEIDMKCWTKDRERLTVRMTENEVENRLKEVGLWQIVTNAIIKASPQFVKLLDSLLLRSFGYAEVETLIRQRALEAVEKRSMEPLDKEIDLEWRNGSYVKSREDVVEHLKKLGIWQLVENEIKK